MNQLIGTEDEQAVIESSNISKTQLPERSHMNQALQFMKKNSVPLLVFFVFLLILLSRSNKVQAFNNNNGRNLPFCDTTMIPSWDPPGIWYEWCGRRWFVPD